MTGQEAQDDEREALAEVVVYQTLMNATPYQEADAILSWLQANGYRKHPETEITDARVDALAKTWLSIDVPLEEVDVWGDRDEWLTEIRAKSRAALEAALRVPVGEGEQDA